MTNEQFQEDFETVIPQMLQVAYDYTGGADEVETIWLYLSNQEGWRNAQAYYRVGGQVLTPDELEGAIDGFDEADGDEIDDLLSPLSDLNDELYASGRKGGDHVPTRVVVRYGVAEQEMNADFHYGDLQPGVPDAQQLDPGSLIDAWVDRLAQTGNDSAAP